MTYQEIEDFLYALARRFDDETRLKLNDVRASFNSLRAANSDLSRQMIPAQRFVAAASAMQGMISCSPALRAETHVAIENIAKWAVTAGDALIKRLQETAPPT